MKPIVYKELRELMPGPDLPGYTEELEKDGSIMILRSLTGRLKDAPLPPLGRENAWGEKLNAGGPERWKTIFFDTIRENGRSTARVEDG
jgi:transcription initiation factor TFIIE subunit beta